MAQINSGKVDSETLIQSVLHGPVGVFLLVALADGTICSGEVNSFLRQVNELSRQEDFPNELSAAFKMLPTHSRKLINQYQYQPRAELFKIVKKSSNTVRDNYSAEVAKKFNEVMINLALEIADASSRILDEEHHAKDKEQQIIQEIQKLFSVNYNVILAGPVGVFLLVASADGKIDNKERVSFIANSHQLCDMNGLSSEVRLIFNKLQDRAQDLIDEHSLKNGTPDQLLDLIKKSTEGVEDVFGLDIAAEFNEVLIDLAIKIASASSGFFGFGKKIDRHENKVINQLKVIFSTKCDAILAGPISVFLLVAAADGKIDDKEIFSFTGKVAQVCETKGLPGEIRTIFLKLRDKSLKMVELHKHKKSNPNELYNLIKDSSKCVEETYDSIIAAKFNELLIDIAMEVANASGGFLGLTSKIDRNERRVIDSLKAILSAR